MSAPLKGLRVIELARILAGPWMGQTLADLGADVIKVEAPEGDDTRRWGPPFARNADGSNSDAAYFHCCNRGKRSVTADFNRADDRAFVTELIDHADVVIENYKMGGLRKFGLDYESLSARNPRLVYCSVTGFGQTGPYASRPGYDAIVQAMGGIMDLTGERDGEPQKIGVAFADLFTGVYGVVAIQAALTQRERTGRGQQIDMALFDVMVSVLANQAMSFLMSGTPPHRMGSAHPSIVPYQPFAVKDGHLMLAVGNDEQFRRLCDVLGLPSLKSDARYQHNADRVHHRDELVRTLGEALARRERDELLRQLEMASVPAGPINNVRQVFCDPQILARGLCVELPDTGFAGGSVPTVRTPISFSDSELSLLQRSPRLGEHTEEIKKELGWPRT